MSINVTRRYLFRNAALMLLAAGSLPSWGGTAEASSGYANYARSLLGNLPANAKVRPELEAYLNGLASSYRQANGRKRLGASDLMRQAARAQAADMMYAGKAGHRSRAGHGFNQRFSAFVENADAYRARAENAAMTSKKGAADVSKAKALFALWVASGGHRRNLMNADYDLVSTGVIQRGEELWAVQIFWSKPVPPNSNPLIWGQ